MNVKIVERGPIQLVGLVCQTLLKDTREQLIIPKLQHDFNQRINEITGLINYPHTYGVFIDPPNYNPETDLFTWIASVEVGNEYSMPDGMITYQIPANKYAVLSYQGNIDDAGIAYDTLYRWITESKYKISDTYGFEMYGQIHSAYDRRETNLKLHFPIIKK